MDILLEPEYATGNFGDYLINFKWQKHISIATYHYIMDFMKVKQDFFFILVVYIFNYEKDFYNIISFLPSFLK